MHLDLSISWFYAFFVLFKLFFGHPFSHYKLETTSTDRQPDALPLGLPPFQGAGSLRGPVS